MASKKTIGTEAHKYDAQGNLEGLYTIDGKKARQTFGSSRFWEGVDEIVRLYKQINPSEFDLAQYENMNVKLNNKNEYGSNESKSFRMVLQLPHGLYLALTDYEQRIFRDKKMRETFMKRYPSLRSCETV